jgi:hypothetical protein
MPRLLSIHDRHDFNHHAMPTILRRLPFYQEATTLRIPSGPAIEIKHHQIIAWVSITSTARDGLNDADARFPALIDPGFNGYFLLRQDHLSDWARIKLTEDDFPILGRLTVHGREIPRFDAEVWLHANVPGFRDQFLDVPPGRLELDAGIAVCERDMRQIRLPLLGLSALRRNRLRLHINGEKKHVSLWSPGAK